MRERFSKRLRRTMKLRGLTQQEVADKANIVGKDVGVQFTRGTISRYMHGFIVPGHKQLIILADVLGVNYLWLQQGDSWIQTENATQGC